ncbi:MAG: hypothetical protein ACLFR0_04770 [Alphaproteobacteria bacterium]
MIMPPSYSFELYCIPAGARSDSRYPMRRTYVPHYYIALRNGHNEADYIGFNNKALLKGLIDPKTDQKIDYNSRAYGIWFATDSYIYDERYSQGTLLESYPITKAKFKKLRSAITKMQDNLPFYWLAAHLYNDDNYQNCLSFSRQMKAIALM